ncbi:MAG: MBL fold metallo-hydrolase [Prevotella sp.]|nr:MBL fold metallo-hydrolase [Prevotella sp.]
MFCPKSLSSSLLLLFILLGSCGSHAQDCQSDTFTTASGKTVTLVPIKHASFRIQYDGREFEIDPVGHYGTPTDYSKLPKADYILVTHEHQDHFSPADIQLLRKAETKVVTNHNCAAQLGYGQVMANGDHLQLAPSIRLDAVPAYNTTQGREQFHPRGRDNGFILTIENLRIYIAGDTEDIPEMAQIHDIDIAFMPCNQPYTMTPEQLARAARTVHPRVLYPYHYASTPVEQVVSLLKDTDIDMRIRPYQ